MTKIIVILMRARLWNFRTALILMKPIRSRPIRIGQSLAAPKVARVSQNDLNWVGHGLNPSHEPTKRNLGTREMERNSSGLEPLENLMMEIRCRQCSPFPPKSRKINTFAKPECRDGMQRGEVHVQNLPKHRITVRRSFENPELLCPFVANSSSGQSCWGQIQLWPIR